MRLTILRSLVFFLLCIPLLGFAGPAAPPGFSGIWTFKIDGRNLFVVTLNTAGATPTGSFERPKGMEGTNTIFKITDPSARVDSLIRSELQGDNLLLTFKDSANEESVFVMRLVGDSAEFGIAGAPPGVGLGPWRLEKSVVKEHVSEDWQQNRSYVQGDQEKSNAELSELFTLDQQERMQQPIDMTKLAAADTARRARTLELLLQGRLTTGADFKNAAFIMQHGDKPDDYLLAHSLAVAAVAKGESTAVWIASATLDRFLQSKGLAQIYGTQMSGGQPGADVIREPFDSRLVPNSLRIQLGVPPLNIDK